MKLPQVRSRECIVALQRAGFVVDRQKGSHVVLKKASSTVVVPFHNKPLEERTLRSIIRQAGLAIEEFIELL